MLNKKGFTLIEMLGTIVILGTLLVVVSISITSIMKKTQAKTYEITGDNLVSTAKLYVMEYPTKFNVDKDRNVEYKCITIGELIDSGYYNEDIKNGKINYNGEELNITNDMPIYIERNIETKVYNEGLVLKNDKESYAKYCDYIKKIPCPILKSYDSKFDGLEHTIKITELSKEYKVKYRTSLEDTWKEELPTRKEVGTTKVYVEVEDKTQKVKYCELGTITIRK